MSVIHDPLEILLREIPPQHIDITRITKGSKYLLVELSDGLRGVAGSPGPAYKPLSSVPASWDLTIPSHRQLLTACYNAYLNSENAVAGISGPEEWIQGAGWTECLMIGFFKPLYNRLMERGIQVIPFDIEKEEPELKPLEEMNALLARVRQVIATPLIFINGSWKDIFVQVGEDHEILLTGPSGTYHEAYTSLPGVKAIFGSTIPDAFDDFASIVRNGGGMQAFKHLVRKSWFHDKR